VPTEEIDDRTTVLALLAMAGIAPSDAEIGAMTAAYPVNRRLAAALYTVPGVRYEEPAVTFDPRV
jgi:hypothetical protein